MSYVVSGFRSPSGSLEIPARWRTASKPERSAAVTSRMSMRTAASSGAPSPNVQESNRKLSSPTTSCPARVSVGTSAAPMYPSCPVTSTLTLGPDFPWRSATLPELIEHDLLAERVHALPEFVMSVCHQLRIGCKPLERLPLEVRFVAVDVVQHRRFEDEEGAVDPAFPKLRLFREADDLVAFEIEMTKAGRRTHGRQRRQLSVGAMEGEQLVEVNGRNAVTPGEHEGLVTELRGEALDTAARLRIKPSVDKPHGPIFRPIVLRIAHDTAVCKEDSDVTRKARVVDEVPFYDFALVAQCDHEVRVTVVGIVLHDVPEHRPAADLNHRLRLHHSLFRESAADAAGEDHDLHRHECRDERSLVARRAHMTRKLYARECRCK